MLHLLAAIIAHSSVSTKSLKLPKLNMKKTFFKSICCRNFSIWLPKIEEMTLPSLTFPSPRPRDLYWCRPFRSATCKSGSWYILCYQLIENNSMSYKWDSSFKIHAEKKHSYLHTVGQHFGTQ